MSGLFYKIIILSLVFSDIVLYGTLAKTKKESLLDYYIPKIVGTIIFFMIIVLLIYILGL